MLKLERTTAEGLEESLGSAGTGVAAWLAGASVGADGELASIAGTATTVRDAAHIDGCICKMSMMKARPHGGPQHVLFLLRLLFSWEGQGPLFSFGRR